MKKTITLILLTLCVTVSALACEPVDIFGKVSNSAFQTVPETRAVVIVDLNSGALYVTPIENGNYAAQSMPGCTTYTVGTPSVRGMWFRSFTVDVGENEAVILNFVGIETRTKPRSVKIDEL